MDAEYKAWNAASTNEPLAAEKRARTEYILPISSAGTARLITDLLEKNISQFLVNSITLKIFEIIPQVHGKKLL